MDHRVLAGRAVRPDGAVEEAPDGPADAGRDPDSFDFGQFGTPPKAEVVDTLIAAGCNRVVFTLPPADADTVIPKLDQISEFKDQYK